MITKTFKLTIATETEEQMQKEEDYLSMTYGAEEIPKRMSNSAWKDFLVEQFGISRTSASEMLHGMMMYKNEDNFKKMFNRR